jgi:hypothetical protein
VAYPNVLVKGYLMTTGQLTPEMKMRMESAIVRGYQKLLTFEVAGGGFNWWQGNTTALVWLTAYGIMEFADMERVTEIDRGVLDRAAEWLFRQQKRDGTWDQPGRTHGERINHLPTPELALTAYVAWALGEAGFAERDGTRRAVRFLEQNWGRADDSYVLALCTNALAANDSGEAAHAALELAKRAKVQGETATWSGRATMSHATGDGADIEATALAAYGLLRAKREAALAEKAVAWLVKHRDTRGGWHSTQGTILAIKTLIESAKQSGRGDGSGQVTMTVNGRPVAGFAPFTGKNNDVVQQVAITDWVRPGENVIELRREGDVRLSWQVAGRYYRPWRPEDDQVERSPLRIDVSYDKETLLVTDVLNATVRLDYEAEGPTFMVIAEVGVPPGFAADTASLDRLVADGKIARYSASARRVTVYIGELRPGAFEFGFAMKPKHPVTVTTAPGVAYEYYTPSRRGESRPRKIEVQ